MRERQILRPKVSKEPDLDQRMKVFSSFKRPQTSKVHPCWRKSRQQVVDEKVDKLIEAYS